MDKTSLIPSADEILKDLGLDHLPEEQKNQVMAGLLNHLSDIVIETFSDNITDDQAAEIQQAIEKSPENSLSLIQSTASRTPGLTDKIMLAVRQELEILKASYENIK